LEGQFVESFGDRFNPTTKDTKVYQANLETKAFVSLVVYGFSDPVVRLTHYLAL
jgi:hypothetical protein